MERRFEAERGGRVERDRRGLERDRAHVDGRGDDLAAGAELDVDGAATAVGVDDEPLAVAEPVARRDPCQAADAVAAHLGASAVGVVEHHRAVGAVVDRAASRMQAVGADAAVAVAERGDAASSTGRSVAEPWHEEVVAGGVELGEADGAHRLQNASRAGNASQGFSAAASQVMRGSRRNHRTWRRAKRRVRRTASSSAASSDGSVPSR